MLVGEGLASQRHHQAGLVGRTAQPDSVQGVARSHGIPPRVRDGAWLARGDLAAPTKAANIVVSVRSANVSYRRHPMCGFASAMMRSGKSTLQEALLAHRRSGALGFAEQRGDQMQALPDGYVILAKRDCPTCELVVPVIQEI